MSHRQRYRKVRTPHFATPAKAYLGLHQRYREILGNEPRQEVFLAISEEEQQKIQKKLTSLFDGMMKALFSQKGATLSVGIMADDKVQDFIREHAAVLDSSFRQVDMSEAMRTRLQESDYIFSGMKTFHELNEAFPSLLDSNGDRKPF